MTGEVMRIAMLAPISWRTPPRHYGPWELVTSLLTEALVARGVDVTLFAPLASQTAGKLCGVCSAPYSADPAIDAKVWAILPVRSEERRVGKECVSKCRSRWWPYHYKKK